MRIIFCIIIFYNFILIAIIINIVYLMIKVYLIQLTFIPTSRILILRKIDLITPYLDLVNHRII